MVRLHLRLYLHYLHGGAPLLQLDVSSVGNSGLVYLVALVKSGSSALGHRYDLLTEPDGKVRGGPALGSVNDPLPRDAGALATGQRHGHDVGLGDTRGEGLDDHQWSEVVEALLEQLHRVCAGLEEGQVKGAGDVALSALLLTIAHDHVGALLDNWVCALGKGYTA